MDDLRIESGNIAGNNNIFEHVWLSVNEGILERFGMATNEQHDQLISYLSIYLYLSSSFDLISYHHIEFGFRLRMFVMPILNGYY